MSEISHADALNTFGSWGRQNKKLAVLGSNCGCVVSVRNAHVTLCLDDMLQLTFSEDGILRFFLRGATFSPVDPGDFPADSGFASAEYETGVQSAICEHRNAMLHFSCAGQSLPLKRFERPRIP
jgi:hypothetical protein